MGLLYEGKRVFIQSCKGCTVCAFVDARLSMVPSKEILVASDILRKLQSAMIVKYTI